MPIRPIHARIAAKILSVSATSSGVERFFSLSGRILSKIWSNLSGDHVNELSCLNKWMYDYNDGRNSVASKYFLCKQKCRNARFATLSLNLELVAGSEEDFEDEEDVDL